MQETLKDVIEALKKEGQLNRESNAGSLGLIASNMGGFKAVFEMISESLSEQNVLLKKSIDRMRAEGQLTRNTGTNSIKSINTNILSFKNIFDSIEKNLSLQNASLREAIEIQNDTSPLPIEDDEIVNGLKAFGGILGSVEVNLTKQTSILSEMLKTLSESFESQKRALELASVGRTTIGGPSQVVGATTQPPTSVLSGGRMALGGLLAAVGTGAAGAGAGVLALGLRGVAAGIAAFANPATIAGGTALIAFLGGIGGVAWLIGGGASRVGQGFKDVADGVEKLNEVGGNLKTENFISAGENLRKFLTEVGGFQSLFGAVITFLTGDLVRISEGMKSLNDVEIDSAKLRNAGSALSAFFTGLGEASFWDRFLGSVTTTLTPDLRSLASGLNALSETSKEIDPQKFERMGRVLGNVYVPIGDFAGAAFWTNFVGSSALVDLAAGISALNRAEVDRLEIVANGIFSLPRPLANLAGSGILATLNRSNALSDLATGITSLNSAQVDNIERVSENIEKLSGPIRSLSASGILATVVRSAALSDLATGITALNGTEINKLADVARALDSITDPLLAFAGSSLISSLANLGSSIADFFSGNPFAKVLELADNAERLERGASALEKVSNALEKFSNIRLNRSRVDFTSLAIDLGTAIPLLRGLAEGGIVRGITNRPLDFEGGLLNPALRLDEVGSVASSLSNAFAAFSAIEMPPPRQRLDLRALAENFNAVIPIVRNLSGELGNRTNETNILPRDFGESIIGIASGILNSLERIESSAIMGARAIVVNNAPVIAPTVQNNQRGGTQVNQINAPSGRSSGNWLDEYSLPNGVH
jgi:hypothetical protein